MRAMAIERFGGPERIREMELPDPKVGPDTVLIRVEAAGVNPVDWKIREGRLEGAFPHFFPLILGWDAAGVVAAVGPAVTEFAVGDPVFAYCRKTVVQEGTYAELVAVPESVVAPRPPELSVVEAGALPLAGLTAFQALGHGVALRADETVLIHAAGGGVGSFAVQLARGLGAHVIATASAAKHDYLRELGAAETIDYRTTDVPIMVRELHPMGIDAIVDVLGGSALADSLPLLKPGGRVVSMAEPPRSERDDIRTRYVFVRPDGAQLAQLGEIAGRGELRVHLEQTYPLDEAATAQEHLGEGHVQGKLALVVE